MDDVSSDRKLSKNNAKLNDENDAENNKADSKEKRDKFSPIFKNYDQFDLERRMFPYLDHYVKENVAELIPAITTGDCEFLEKDRLPVFNKECEFSDKRSYVWNETQTF